MAITELLRVKKLHLRHKVQGIRGDAILFSSSFSGSASSLLWGYVQEDNELWEVKTVQCATGNFIVGDYTSWRKWHNSLPGVEKV